LLSLEVFRKVSGADPVSACPYIDVGRSELAAGSQYAEYSLPSSGEQVLDEALVWKEIAIGNKWLVSARDAKQPAVNRWDGAE